MCDIMTAWGNLNVFLLCLGYYRVAFRVVVVVAGQVEEPLDDDGHSRAREGKGHLVMLQSHIYYKRAPRLTFTYK